MTLSVAQIMERVRHRYNATGDGFFSDTMLRALIFSAQEELAKEGWVIEETFTTTSTSGTRELAFPTNTLAIKEVKYDYKKLRKMILGKDPKTSTTEPTGTPGSYAIWDGVIILFPTPDTTGDTIQIRTYSYPQDVDSNVTELDVPNEYHDDLINFVLAHMCLKDQNITLYQQYISLWRQTVEKAIEQRRKMLRADRPARVKDEYFGYDSYTLDGVLDGWTV